MPTGFRRKYAENFFYCSLRHPHRLFRLGSLLLNLSWTHHQENLWTRSGYGKPYNMAIQHFSTKILWDTFVRWILFQILLMMTSLQLIGQIMGVISSIFYTTSYLLLSPTLHYQLALNVSTLKRPNTGWSMVLGIEHWLVSGIHTEAVQRKFCDPLTKAIL